jgi:hypothetical protein
MKYGKNSPEFRGNRLHPSSGSKSKPRKQPARTEQQAELLGLVLTMKMQAVNFYHTTCHYIWEDSTYNCHRCGSLDETCQDSPCPGQGSNPASAIYKSRASPLDQPVRTSQVGCCGQSGSGVAFLWVLWLPMSILIPPITTHSLIILSSCATFRPLQLH